MTFGQCSFLFMLFCVTSVSTSTECDNKGCKNNAPTCTIHVDQDSGARTLVYCHCTPGFMDKYCTTNKIPSIHARSKAIRPYSGEISDVIATTTESQEALVDQVNQNFTDLVTSLEKTSEIQERNIYLAETIAKKSDDIKQLVYDFGNMTDQIFTLTKTLQCTLCPVDMKLAQTYILKAEESLMRMYKLYLKNKETTKIESFQKNIISSAILKDKGKDLPLVFTASFGNFKLPFWESFQDVYEKRYISIIILTYSESPYIFAGNPDAVNTGIVKIYALNQYMVEIGLPDLDDPVDVNADGSSSLSSSTEWQDMTLQTNPVGAYMVTVSFNYTIVAMITELKFDTMKRCTVWGRYGYEKPTEHIHDIIVKTKGLNLIENFSPSSLSVTFKNKILQMSFNFPKDEAIRNPLIIISRCEDDYARRRRSTGALGGRAHQFRIAEVDLRTFNRYTGRWERTNNIELKSGTGNNVAFKSKFFGTFSADVLFIAPQTLDFEEIFLNFPEKLKENPYGLATIVSLWIIFLLVAIPLRRVDKSDQELWQYAPLIGNKPSSAHIYYIAVSTAVRSVRNFTANIYFEVKGDKTKSAPLQMSDGYRQNFIRGTTSYFCMKSEQELGELESVTIWHDNAGKNPRWLLSKIIIADGATSKRYIFSCGEWLSHDSADGRIYRTLTAMDDDMVDNEFMFSDLTKSHLFDEHLWFSILKRPSYSRYSRVQRMWSIAALLFLSMIASAMFFNTPENKQMRSINLGPLVLSYKQVYVGFMSAALVLIPSMIIINIFKNRRQKGESNEVCPEEESVETKKSRCCKGSRSGLPWWMIFFGYGLICGSIFSSSFFVFLYSLDWGSELTIQWMMAVFMGINQSIFIMEPIKAILLAVLLTCCCARSAKTSLADMPIPRSDGTSTDVEENTAGEKIKDNFVPCPRADLETDGQRRYKRRLKLDRELSTRMRSWSIHVLYLAIIFIICNNENKEGMFLQNSYLRNNLKPTFLANTTEDIYDWIEQFYTPKIYSKWHYEGILKTVYLQRFTEEMYHLHVGLTRLRQVRAKGSCSIPPIMRERVHVCSLAYSNSSEDRQNYCPGWKNFSTACFDENEETDYGYLYQSSTETRALTHYGTHGSYGGGGYVVDIGPKLSLAVDYLQRIRQQNWIDRNTRAVFIECMLFNANSNLFSHVRVVFELPFYGGITMKTVVTSSNLYPYTTSWDYITLGLQALFLLILLVRLVLVCVEIVKTKCRHMLSLFGVVRTLEILFGIAAAIFYILRIDETIGAIEEIFENFGRFVSFEKVVLFDMLYNSFLGGMAFISIIDTLRPLSFNYYIHLMRTTIASSIGEFFSFTVILLCYVMGFASILFLLYGHMVDNFRDIPTALLSLFRVMIGMVNFRQQMHLETIGVIVLFGMYCMMVTVILMNLFISALNIAMADAETMASEPGRYKYDKKLSKHVWKKVNALFGRGNKTTKAEIPVFTGDFLTVIQKAARQKGNNDAMPPLQKRNKTYQNEEERNRNYENEGGYEGSEEEEEIYDTYEDDQSDQISRNDSLSLPGNMDIDGEGFQALPLHHQEYIKYQMFSSPDIPQFELCMNSLFDKLVVQYEDDTFIQKQILRTCLLLVDTFKESVDLRCTSVRRLGATNYTYFDLKSRIVLVLDFHTTMKDAALPVCIINVQDASRFSVTITTDHSIPLSGIFVVDTYARTHVEGVPVDIKIIRHTEIVRSSKSRTIVLLVSFNDGETWEKLPTAVSENGSPCISGTCRTCPTNFMAVMQNL